MRALFLSCKIFYRFVKATAAGCVKRTNTPARLTVPEVKNGHVMIHLPDAPAIYICACRVLTMNSVRRVLLKCIRFVVYSRTA